jgi:AhpD family alkylhydroperoxidase
VPELLEVALPFIGTALSPSAIDFPTKEIVILRTSALLRCRYCIDSHTPVALDAGHSSARVRALRDEPGTDLDLAFTDARERALIAWTDAVATGRGPIDPTVSSAMSEHFADHEIVELTVLVGATMLLNRYATALQLPVGEATIARLAADGFARS